MYDLKDTELAKQISLGDRDAFRELYDLNHTPLYHLAKSYVKDPALAEDAVHDIFVKLWEKRARLDPSGSVKGYLFTMLKNHLLNMIRDRKTRILLYKQNASLLEDSHRLSGCQTEDEIAFMEYRQIVGEGLEQLSDRKREVFELKTYSGHSNSEISDLLKISVRTVKTHYYNSSKFIRIYLKEHAGITSVMIVFTQLLFW